MNNFLRFFNRLLFLSSLFFCLGHDSVSMAQSSPRGQDRTSGSNNRQTQGPVASQPNSRGRQKSKAEREQPQGLTVESAFKPAFFCTPAVNRIQARKGQTINFKFKLEPVRESVSVTVRPVALKQTESGALQADLESPPPAGMRINGAGEYDLIVGSETELSGRIKLPSNDSDFHSFGILVQDNGFVSNDRGLAGESTFGVKFVSQYILRCDVEVTNGRGTDIQNLQLESADIVELNGVPTARVVLYNPTESTVEFEMQSKLERAGYIENKTGVGLFVRNNSNYDPPKKFVTQIFPQTRLELVSGWPAAVFPGEYEMVSKIVRNRKTIRQFKTPLSIGADSFPAQSAFAAEVADGVHANPSQIYLSRKRGAKRFVPVNLTNFSTQSVRLQIEPTDDSGEPTSWLLVRPNVIELKPGENRKAMVSLKSLADKQSHRIASLKISEVGGNPDKITFLPVAFQGTDPFVPTLATNQLRIDTALNGGSLVVDVRNQSNLPLPIDAEVRFKNSNGNTVEIKGGYGKWLLPNAIRRLEFKVDAALAEGEFPVQLSFVDTQSKLLAQRDFVLKLEKEFEEVADKSDDIKK